MSSVGRSGVARRLLYCLLLVGAGAAHSQDSLPFTVTAIRIEGLQRITEGALLNTLPVNVGDQLDAQHVREALRAVYASGFFRDVELRREEPGVLVVVVQECPSIRSFEVKGNKEIKTEDLQKSLRNVGLATGKIFNRSTLEDVRQFLTEQYFAHGRYDVRIEPKVEELSGNLVDVHIDIVEGKRARIRQINIVGNDRFTDKEIRENLELKESNLLSFYRQDDRYSKESLEGDLEKIRSFYMDRGYADFEITSTQVAMAPEKNDLFVTVNVFEGHTWKTGPVKLAGNFVVPEHILRNNVFVQQGETWSQREVAATEEAIRNRLGEAGYAFAQVTGVPQPDPETNQIALTFQIEPNSRAYVRRIEFQGVERTNDDVLRREVRQLEGAALSNVALKRSEERLQRLPYIKKAEFETNRVPGSEDLVDVDFKVEEGPSSQISGGVGYSETQSFVLNANYADSNLFGSGNRLAVELNGGQYSKVYSVSHTNPYWTADGVSLTLNASYIERERLTSSFSDFNTTTYSAGVGIGYPLSENQYLNYNLVFNHEDLATVFSSSTQLRDWVRENGESYFRRVGTDPVLGTLVDTLEFDIGWNWDSRDRYLFPTRGGSHRFTIGYAPPGGSVEFVTANWHSQQLFRLPIPLIDQIPISLSTTAGWGKALGNTTALPPNRHIFTGGSDSVRGFKDGSLGPRDSLGNPYGGDAGVAAQLEAIVPLTGKLATSARISLFLDAGQSFFLGDTEFRNRRGDRTSYPFDLSELRVSTGLAIQWLSPMGLFRFSYAIPLQYQQDTRRLFGDEIDRFQFSVGQAF